MEAAGTNNGGACESVEPFNQWLSAKCRNGGDPNNAGTVLVWRDRDGVPVHAAVAIGDGWALEKPSQEWHSPHAIAAIRDVVHSARLPGQWLEKHTVSG